MAVFTLIPVPIPPARPAPEWAKPIVSRFGAGKLPFASCPWKILKRARNREFVRERFAQFVKNAAGKIRPLDAQKQMRAEFERSFLIP